MSRELVKWQGGKLVPSPIEQNKRVLGQALVLLTPRPPMPARSNRADVCTCGVAEIVDLPRICAVHDKPFAARYVIGADGRYRHAQTIKVTQSLYEAQYENGENATVPDGDLGDEACPWCGASGVGAVRCGGCGAEVCRGKTTRKHFRCRKSCGYEGKMFREERTHRGAVPGATGRGSWSAF